MKHDPLCEWSAPCIHGENQQHSRDTENPAVPDATYCWMCGADCLCDLIAKVRQDQCSLCCTKAEAAIAAAEAKAHQFVAALVHSQGGEVVITFHDLLSVDRNPVLERFDNPDGSITLRALQEKP